jgi:hypothetical protein
MGMSLALAAAVQAVPLRVDISPDNGRRDVLTRTTDNWRVADGASSQFQKDAFSATLRAVDAALVGVLWKGGLDTGATLSCDGVTLKPTGPSPAMELVLEGLAPGPQSAVLWLSSTEGTAPARLDVNANDGPVVAITPTSRVPTDADAAHAFLAFDVPADGRVTIRIASTDGVAPVLNGFAVGVPDPALQASRPTPAHGFEHAEPSPTLRWTPSANATAQHIYFGTDPDAVAQATPESSEFKGEVASSASDFEPGALDHMLTYYWRIDSAGAQGVTRGEVWPFRVRHLAFPGAEGYGRFARGGRGGRVIEVTSLEDSGPGTLREAIDAEGPRTVVFRVGGVIRLNSKLVIRNPYITIAGQTAPGDGIATYGYTFGLSGTNDAIVRYMRIRVGDESGSTMDGTGFASSDHSIMDHCSVAWSIDEGVSSRGAKNITFQRSIVAEALNIANHAKYQPGRGHSFAASIGGNIGSFHHNLLAHCAGRNWSLAGGLNQAGKFAGFLDIRNNVVYNWQHRTTDGGARKVNFVGNYYIPGPATRPDVRHFVKAQLELKLPDDIQQYYVADNFMEGHPEQSSDNLRGGGLIFQHTTPDEERRMVLSEPFCEPHITVRTAREAYESVIDDVGANIPRHDAIDQRVLNDVRNRSFTATGSRGNLPGIIDSQADVGGMPDLKGGEAPIDADRDGMADWWELERDLDPANPDDRNVIGEAGFTMLEHYLNWIVENGGLEPRQK